MDNSVQTAPGRNGGRLLVGGNHGNSGGKKGRSGRRPDWLKDFCDDLLSSPKCKAAVRAILSDENHAAFATMWKAVAERAHGKADQNVTHRGKIQVNVRREPRPMLHVDN